ncbi:perlucin-like protein [Oratosquilla oratoria]|uniref:perlucin-like protein n=1 Tax=Oratosquilla oratoria TaxID=337810 RepID=UPI003F773D93
MGTLQQWWRVTTSRQGHKPQSTSRQDRSFWIGGVDIGDNNNKWQWLNGSLVDLSVGWSRYQPDKLKGENCIHYWYNKDWFLNDSLCSNIKNFVRILFILCDVCYMLATNRSFWIGGVDIGDNNKWQWLNGSLVDLSVGWSRYQPDKLKGENCIHYWHLSNWLLNDNVCSVMMNFVCQDAVHVL